MKPITKDTKISDLIPEGYEFDNANSAEAYSEEKGGALFVTIFRKKKVKSFDDYVDEYLKSYFSENDSPVLVSNKMRIKENNFGFVKFELKIGLLKFICDDIGFDFYNYLSYRNNIRIGQSGINPLVFGKLEKIVPPEFIHSIL